MKNKDVFMDLLRAGITPAFMFPRKRVLRYTERIKCHTTYSKPTVVCELKEALNELA